MGGGGQMSLNTVGSQLGAATCLYCGVVVEHKHYC